jgi:hypothetical protein
MDGHRRRKKKTELMNRENASCQNAFLFFPTLAPRRRLHSAPPYVQEGFSFIIVPSPSRRTGGPDEQGAGQQLRGGVLLLRVLLPAVPPGARVRAARAGEAAPRHPGVPPARQGKAVYKLTILHERRLYEGAVQVYNLTCT